MTDTPPTVGALREVLARYPDNAPLLCQVVAQDGTAWNLQLRVAHGDECGFKWEVNPAIFSLSPPELLTLPKDPPNA